MPTAYKPLGQVVAGTVRVAMFISNKVLTSNVVTLTSNAVHGLAVGDIVEIQGVDSVCDGTYAVATVPTTTTFTYAKTGSNISTVGVSPVAPAWRTHNLGGIAVSNKLSVNGLVTITTSSAHNLIAGDWVMLSIGDTTANGLLRVWAVPATTLLCFKVGTYTVGTAAAGGAVGKATSAWVTIFGPITGTGKAVIMSTIVICNGGEYSANVRLGLATSVTPTIAERTAYEATIAAGEALLLTIGLTADVGKYLLGQSNQPDVTFSTSVAEITP